MIIPHWENGGDGKFELGKDTVAVEAGSVTVWTPDKQDWPLSALMQKLIGCGEPPPLPVKFTRKSVMV